MSLMKNKTFQKYFVPGIVFQSLVIAGGYGTGRELVEFFLEYGTVGGLLGITCVSLTVWSVICAVTFVFARKFGTFDYKSLFEKLLGRAWPVYEVCYFALILLILAVVASSAGDDAGSPLWPQLLDRRRRHDGGGRLSGAQGHRGH